MSLSSLIVFLIIGAIAGWLAGKLMKKASFGLVGNMALGVVGAVIGGYVFGVVGISAGGFIGSIITATVGAALLLFVVGLIKNK